MAIIVCPWLSKDFYIGDNNIQAIIIWFRLLLLKIHLLYFAPPKNQIFG